jgi:hypothetical protein
LNSDINKEQPRFKQGDRRITSKLKAQERFYKWNFYLFEISYILFALPVLVISLVSIPVLYYVILTKGFPLWISILIGITIAFFQILCVRYVFKRFVLHPNEMSLGQFLRHQYITTIQKKKPKESEIKNISQNKNNSWYASLDEFIFKIKEQQRRQTEEVFRRVYPDTFQQDH